MSESWPSPEAEARGRHLYERDGAILWALAILENELETPDDMWADHIRQAVELLRLAAGDRARDDDEPPGDMLALSDGQQE